MWVQIVKVFLPTRMFGVNMRGYHGPRKVEAVESINFGTLLHPLVYAGDQCFVEKDQNGKWWATKYKHILRCIPTTAPNVPNVPLPSQAISALSDYTNFSPYIEQLQPFPPDFINAGILTPTGQRPTGMGGGITTGIGAPAILGVSRIYSSPSGVNAIATDGKYIYAEVGVSASNEHLVLVDVSDPNNPVAVASLDLGAVAVTATPSISVVDSIVTVTFNVTGTTGKMVLCGVDHSTAPPTLSLKSTTTAAAGTTWYDNVPFTAYTQPGKIYVALAENAASSGIRIYEITNPAAPVNTGNLLNAGWQAEWITASDSTVFLADNFTGVNTVLHSIDVSTPATPVSLQDLNLVVNPDWRIRTTRNILLAASNFRGAWVLVNVSNPSAMTILRTVSNNDIAEANVMNGNTVYGSDGLVYNAYDTTGTKIATGTILPTGGDFPDAAFHGNHAYVGGHIFINPNTWAAVGVVALPGS